MAEPKVTSDLDEPGPWWNVVRKTRLDASLRREADTMGFYAAVALLVALTARADGTHPSQLEVLAIVWGTTVGLAIGHWFALMLSAQLVKDPDIHHTAGEVLFAQMAFAVTVAVLASAVVLIVPERYDRLGGRVAAGLFIAALVVVELRSDGATLQRRIFFGSAALAVAFAIATITWFIK